MAKDNMSGGSAERPLSPHLQVYRLPMTALMSISHRATGVINITGLCLVVWMLVAAATGPGAFAIFSDFIGSWPGKIMLLGWTLSLSYHMGNGIRHLIWDTGRLLDLDKARVANWVVLVWMVGFTALIWFLAGGI